MSKTATTGEKSAPSQCPVVVCFFRINFALFKKNAPPLSDVWVADLRRPLAPRTLPDAAVRLVRSLGDDLGLRDPGRRRGFGNRERRRY